MSEQPENIVAHEAAPASEGLFPVESEYTRCVRGLNRTGIVTILPQSESLGVLGGDGKEYPLPAPEELHALFLRNRELVEGKMHQGFTRLALTPMALPVSILVDRAKQAVLKHAKTGMIVQTKQQDTDPDVAIAVNIEKPVWVWDTLKAALDTEALVYFPQSYSRDHYGLTKPDVVHTGSLCAVLGWSVSLIEPFPTLPQQGKGQTLGGRKQLETNSTPHDYLNRLHAAEYQGETGWTPEDFLTHFITRLDETNQITHDWDDRSALWLTGSWLPQAGKVPAGHWYRGNRQLGMSTDHPSNRGEYWGARATVRLGI